MLEDYLIVHKSVLPDYFSDVINVKHLLESGKVKNVSQAVKEIGISRSTYYKYKDYIMEPSNSIGGRNAVLSMLLTHETGVLSHVLSCISKAGASVLTITQSLPVHGKASVTISIDISSMDGELSDLLQEIENTDGAEKAKLIAVE